MPGGFLPGRALLLGHLAGPENPILEVPELAGLDGEPDGGLCAEPADGGEGVGPADLGMVHPSALDPLAHDPAAMGSERSRDAALGLEDLGSVEGAHRIDIRGRVSQHCGMGGFLETVAHLVVAWVPGWLGFSGWCFSMILILEGKRTMRKGSSCLQVEQSRLSFYLTVALVFGAAVTVVFKLGAGVGGLMVQ